MTLYIVHHRRPGEGWKQDLFTQPSKAMAVAAFLECDGCEVKYEARDAKAEEN